jgi:hypothetical protein
MVTVLRGKVQRERERERERERQALRSGRYIQSVTTNTKDLGEREREREERGK